MKGVIRLQNVKAFPNHMFLKSQRWTVANVWLLLGFTIWGFFRLSPREIIIFFPFFSKYLLLPHEHRVKEGNGFPGERTTILGFQTIKTQVSVQPLGMPFSNLGQVNLSLGHIFAQL